jgi:hypothetical protein
MRVIFIILLLTACVNTETPVIPEPPGHTRISHSIEVISLTGLQDGTLKDYEMLISLGMPGNPIYMPNITLQINGVNATYMGNLETCDHILSEHNFCTNEPDGDYDGWLESDEVMSVVYSSADGIGPGDEFSFRLYHYDRLLTWGSGEAPSLFQTKRIPLWPIG